MTDLIAKSLPRFWLDTPSAWIGYILAWLAFSAGFTAVFLITSQPSVSNAASASLYVVLPAAFLGIGVIWLCRFIPLPGYKRPWFFIAHLALAFMYSVIWIALVAGVQSVRVLITQRSWNFMLPSNHVAHWHFFAGTMIYFTLVSVTYAIDRAARAEARHRQAEIWMLRARLNPHFLFNTLHSLMALVQHDADVAEKAFEQFAGLLRYTLRANQDLLDETTLSEEWAFTRDYLDLEKLRLGERLRVETEFDKEAMHCLVPVFLLQPMVENAIRHAIAPRAIGGTVWINARCEGDQLIITVKDDGSGDTQADAPNSSGVGLKVVRERLNSRYGRKALFETIAESGRGFTVKMQIPIREEQSTPHKEGE